MADLPRVLVVDDEPFMLSALERTLSFSFRVTTAEGAQAALARLESEPPFDVVLSDMWMPGMDGAELLEQVRARSPDTVRIVLTGLADAAAATGAVNRGSVFRFLSKPCPPETLLDTVAEAVEHRKVLRAERRLLSETLTAVVEVLANVMAVAAPTAFRRSAPLVESMGYAVSKLGWPEPWKFEVAATLCKLGCIAIPEQILEKAHGHEALTEEEKAMLNAHPETGHRLLQSIPRLEEVADIIRYQARPVPEEATVDVRRGAKLLRMCLHFERLQSAGLTATESLSRLREIYPHNLVAGLEGLRPDAAVPEPHLVRVDELRGGMVLDQDVRSLGGACLVTKGQHVTDVLQERLQRFAKTVGVEEPFRVLFQKVA